MVVCLKKSNVLPMYNFCTNLESKGNNDKLRRTEFISLTAMWISRLQYTVFPQAKSTPRKKLTRQTKRICKEMCPFKYNNGHIN